MSTSAYIQCKVQPKLHSQMILKLNLQTPMYGTTIKARPSLIVFYGNGGLKGLNTVLSGPLCRMDDPAIWRGIDQELHPAMFYSTGGSCMLTGQSVTVT